MTTKLSLDEMKKSVAASQQAFLALIDSIAPSLLYAPAGDGGWAAGAIMLHVSEAREYFGGDINRLVDSNFAGTIGRGLADERRIAAIEAAQKGNIDAAGIRARLNASYATLSAALDRLSQRDLERIVINCNPKVGAQPFWDFIGRFVVEHDADHVKQVKAAIAVPAT